MATKRKKLADVVDPPRSTRIRRHRRFRKPPTSKHHQCVRRLMSALSEVSESEDCKKSRMVISVLPKGETIRMTDISFFLARLKKEVRARQKKKAQVADDDNDFVCIPGLWMFGNKNDLQTYLGNSTTCKDEFLSSISVVISAASISKHVSASTMIEDAIVDAIQNVTEVVCVSQPDSKHFESKITIEKQKRQSTPHNTKFDIILDEINRADDPSAAAVKKVAPSHSMVLVMKTPPTPSDENSNACDFIDQFPVFFKQLIFKK
jgi:hypothetical protein